MTFGEFVDFWREYVVDNPEERKGQALFNCLLDEAPEMADRIRGTALDPYYVYSIDELTDTLEYIEEYWEA